MSTILVTGANGFVGSHLCNILELKGHTVRRAVRSLDESVRTGDADWIETGDINAETDWHHALEEVDAVVHLAARVHVLKESSADPLTAFRNVNTLATENLATQAAEQGVRRFVYFSSIKAAVSTTTTDSLREDDPAHPEGAYGLSKYEAELAVLRIGRASKLEPVIIRPPLVYGPGVGGNFLRMLNIVRKGIPLPFRSVNNARSLVSVFNLCDFVACCLDHPAAANQIFNVSDGRDLSTPGMLEAIGAAMNRNVRLWRFPPQLLRVGLATIGRGDDFDRLFGSLSVNTDKARDVIGWKPLMSVSEGLRETVDWYLDR